jgi:hypothetical protein
VPAQPDIPISTGLRKFGWADQRMGADAVSAFASCRHVVLHALGGNGPGRQDRTHPRKEQTSAMDKMQSALSGERAGIIAAEKPAAPVGAHASPKTSAAVVSGALLAPTVIIMSGPERF